MRIKWETIIGLFLIFSLLVMGIIVYLSPQWMRNYGFGAGAFFFLFLVCCYIVGHGVVTRQMTYEGDVSKRDEQPLSYWFSLISMTVFGLACGVISILFLWLYLR